MAVIEPTSVHHLRLTVTDIDRSRAFYTEVLGFPVVAESPDSPTDPEVRADSNRLYGGVLCRAPGMFLGLRPVAAAGDRFDSERVGLDHLSFTVASVNDLHTAAQRLAEHGIPHGEVRELAGFGIAILSFDEPDGIHLELAAGV